MSVDDFLKLPDDGCNYELIDGVVVMSPSPTPEHQHVTMKIAAQIEWFLRDHPVGIVLPEIDVHIGQGPTGGDLVYRPEIVFIRAERLRGMRERIVGAPDVVVEVISRGSRRMDTETKKDDYERFGVREYWLIDPEREAMTFYRLDHARFVEVSPERNTFTSEAIPGFTLHLGPVRESFKPW